MIVVGITGTLGAGKGAVVERLKQKGFVHYSVREFLVEELNKRGLPANRDTTTPLANELRGRHGAAHIVLALYKRAQAKGKNAIIESIRALGEEEALRKEKNFFLIGVDADPHLRYGRVVERASELDHVSFEKFLEDERREMYSADPTKQNIAGVLARADAMIYNNGSFDELHEQVDSIFEKLQYAA